MDSLINSANVARGDVRRVEVNPEVTFNGDSKDTFDTWKSLFNTDEVECDDEMNWSTMWSEYIVTVVQRLVCKNIYPTGESKIYVNRPEPKAGFGLNSEACIGVTFYESNKLSACCGYLEPYDDNTYKICDMSKNVVLVQGENPNRLMVLITPDDLIVDYNVKGKLRRVRRIDNVHAYGDIELNKGEELVISGDVVIHGHLFGNTEVRISGKQVYKNRLTILSTDEMQPCIGGQTHDNLSYGRWSFAPYPVRDIFIDNVQVECKHNKSETFTIGNLGLKEVPNVKCEGYGELNCPEMLHVRVMLRGPEIYSNSTKMTGYPVYRLLDGQPGELTDLPDDIKGYYEELKALSEDMAKNVTIFTRPNGIRTAIDLLKLNPECNVELLLSDKINSSTMIAASACVLGIQDLYSPIEFNYSMAKIDYFAKKYYNNPDLSKDSMPYMIGIAHHLFGDDFDKLTPWQIRYTYELIPEYEFAFADKSKEQCAREFFNCSYIEVIK